MNGNHLFRNTGDGTFENITDLAGVAYQGHSNSATFFDYDKDGYLDLYLTNIGDFTKETINEQIGYYVGEALDFDLLATDTSQPFPGEKNLLWRNNGDGTFVDVTDATGVGAASWNGDATVWDYDQDGDLDLYVANMFGANNLYRNDDGKFVDVAPEALGLTSWGAIGCRFFDADNDLRADLVVVDMHSDMFLDPYKLEAFEALDPKAKYRTPAGSTAPGRLGQPITGNLDRLVKDGKTVLFGNSFFHNQGDGKFQEMSDAAGLETWWPWGIAVADFDRDGLQDVFLPQGMSYPYVHWPNRLMRNLGGLKFEDVAGTAWPRAQARRQRAGPGHQGPELHAQLAHRGHPGLRRGRRPRHGRAQLQRRAVHPREQLTGALLDRAAPGGQQVRAPPATPSARPSSSKPAASSRSA